MNKDAGQTALEIKALNTVERYGMLDCSNVLVGVSGGADSMALLCFLCSLREKSGLKVFAAHINHGLRGEESERDELYVREACKKIGVELFVLRSDAAEEASKAGETLEEAGRRLRYTFFEEHAAKLTARIATAHTLSDNMETLIFNLTRGAGLRGLCGIPPVRKDKLGNIVIRPLINCIRHDTEEYCQKYGVKYVNDSTNFIADCSRNKIRLEVIPKLYEINPAFDRAAERLLSVLTEDEMYLTSLAEERLNASIVGDGKYDTSKLCDHASLSVLSRCIALAAYNFSGVNQEAAHINKVIDMLNTGSGKIQIKSGDFAAVRDGILMFSHPQKTTLTQQAICVPFAPGIYKYGNISISVKQISSEEVKNLKNINKVYFKNTIDCDKIIGNAMIRVKTQGETFSPMGRNVTKTLKKLFNEAKIPASMRPIIPLVADDEGVVWVGGIGVCSRISATENSKNAVLLEYKHLEV